MKGTPSVQSIWPQGLWLDVTLGDSLLFKTELSLESKDRGQSQVRELEVTVPKPKRLKQLCRQSQTERRRDTGKLRSEGGRLPNPGCVSTVR